MSDNDSIIPISRLRLGGGSAPSVPRRAVEAADVVLLKMPNHNMDYPHLATPTLTQALREKGYRVKQQDVNVLLRDHLLTEPLLRELAYEFLPRLARAHLGSPSDFDRVRNALVYLRYIDSNMGFAAVEGVKRDLQARRYEEVFTDDRRSSAALLVFVLTGLLHSIIDLALTYDESEGGELENPVTRFLHRKVQEVAALKPRLVGFSIIQIQRKATLWFARRLRPLIDGHIVVGGPDVSTFKLEYLQHSCIDFAFLKEAETTLIEFLQGRPVAELSGVVYRDEHGQTRVNEPRHDIQLSAFRPDFDGYDLDKFLLPTLPLSTSRGCAFAKCTFCNHYKTYSGYYSNDAKKTVDNIQYLVNRYGSRFFHFVDDMLEVKEGSAIAEELIRRNLDVNIITYARFETPFFRDPSILDLWQRAGIRVIEWGLESASQQVLRKMIKGVSIKQVQSILDNSARHGIVNKLMLFHNYPGETVDDLKTTVDFLRKNVREKKVRPFFTVRGKLELRLFTPLEMTSREPARSPFRKRFERSSSFDSLLGYADEDNYHHKVEYIEQFIREMSGYLGDHRIFSTNDENMSLDLIILDLKRRGYQTAVEVQEPGPPISAEAAPWIPEPPSPGAGGTQVLSE